MAKSEIRMSGPTLKVLKLFLTAPRDELSGLEISKRAGVRVGTIYPVLARLEEVGWLASDWENVDPSEAGRPRRRFYRITALGQTRAREAMAEFQMPHGVFAQEGLAWNS